MKFLQPKAYLSHETASPEVHFVPTKRAPDMDILTKVNEFLSLENGALREGATESFLLMNWRSENIGPEALGAGRQGRPQGEPAPCEVAQVLRGPFGKR